MGRPVGSSRTPADYSGAVEHAAKVACRALCREELPPRLAKPNEQALENRYPSLGGSRVQIPPPPLPVPNPRDRRRAHRAGQGGDARPARRGSSVGHGGADAAPRGLDLALEAVGLFTQLLDLVTELL